MAMVDDHKKPCYSANPGTAQYGEHHHSTWVDPKRERLNTQCHKEIGTWGDGEWNYRDGWKHDYTDVSLPHCKACKKFF